MNKRCGWWGSEDQWRNGSTGHKGNEDMNNFLWQQNSCPCGKYWAEADWWQWRSDEGARPSSAAEQWTAFLPCQEKEELSQLAHLYLGHIKWQQSSNYVLINSTDFFTNSQQKGKKLAYQTKTWGPCAPSLTWDTVPINNHTWAKLL